MHQRRTRARAKKPRLRPRVLRREPPVVRTVSLLIRFSAKIRLPLSPEGIPCDDPQQCWEWGAYVGKNNGYGVGYGQIRGDYDHQTRQSGKLLKAHVASYLLFHGPIPRGWDVCHACDNTVCVNPHHLFAAPHKANMQDYIRKYGGLGRPKSPVTVDQLTLFRDQGHEPFLSETWDPYEFDAPGDAALAADHHALRESEVPF